MRDAEPVLFGAWRYEPEPDPHLGGPRVRLHGNGGSGALPLPWYKIPWRLEDAELLAELDRSDPPRLIGSAVRRPAFYCDCGHPALAHGRQLGWCRWGEWDPRQVDQDWCPCRKWRLARGSLWLVPDARR
jgi:hypothetical protein